LTGFIYYLICPFLAFQFLKLENITPVSDVLPYLSKNFFDAAYFVDLFVILIMFYTGYKLSFLIKLNENLKKFDALAFLKRTPIYLFLTISLLTLLLMISFLQKGGTFFSGYTNFDVSFLGQVSTLTFLGFFFHNFFESPKLKKLFILLLIFQSGILLGLGTRNIVMNGIVTIFLSSISLNKKILVSIKFYLVLFLFMLLILFIGVWRTGYLLNINSLFGIFLAEPVFVLSSANVYFSKIGGRPFLNFPFEIIISIINFIPSFVLPQKVDILNFFLQDVQRYSPFGASSVFVSLYSNFGMLYFLYVIAIGVLFGYLYRKALISNFYRSIYFSAAPLIIFQFYNQFLYAFFKLLFWNTIFLPIIIFIFIKKVVRVNESVAKPIDTK
jgi:hypothetical protein